MVVIGIRLVIMGLRMVRSFLIMDRKVAKIGQMDIKMIVIWMVSMDKDNDTLS